LGELIQNISNTGAEFFGKWNVQKLIRSMGV